MKVGYYVARNQGSKCYLLAGPFLSIDETSRAMQRLKTVKVTDCPEEFINPRSFDYGDGFVRITKHAHRTNLPKSWLGNGIDEKVIADLF